MTRRLKLLSIVATVFALIVWSGADGDAQITSEASRLFEALELKPGMTVGEIGAGRGEMTLELSSRLGPNGRVYSNEIDPARLADIRNAVAQKQVTNVTVVEGGESSTNFPAGCCDAIFMRDVYHHLTRPREINENIFAALKPGGRFIVIDFEPRPNMFCSDGVATNREGHGIRPDIVVQEAKATGFREAQPSAEWITSGRTNARMFFVLFRK